MIEQLSPEEDSGDPARRIVMPLHSLLTGTHCRLLFFFFLLPILVSCGNEQRGLKLGDPAPRFAALDLEGSRLSLDSFRGQPVIMRFWSTECRYCRADTIVFNQYFTQYGEQGLGVVYINTEADPATLRKFVTDLEIEFPVLSDPKGRIAASYFVKLLPQTIILDSDHRIIGAMLGGVSREELQDLLGPFLPSE
jgi:peroxiredoxin